MRILIVGGTRLMGLALLEKLASCGHAVTVISRRKTVLPDGVEQIVSEKRDALRTLSDFRYDVVFDFLAYKADDVNNVLDGIKFDRYVCISSVWMAKLPGVLVDTIPETMPGRPEDMPDVTYEYLAGKCAAENVVYRRYLRTKDSVVLRLPIFWGKDEHTGRLDYYCGRVNDGHPVILVDGGMNATQIAWTEDLARAISEWIKMSDIGAKCVWEALPHDGVPVRAVVEDISAAYSMDPSGINVRSAYLKVHLPEFLEEEPLWREKGIPLSSSNIFSVSGITPSGQKEWIKKIAPRGKIFSPGCTRGKEILMIEEMKKEKGDVE